MHVLPVYSRTLGSTSSSSIVAAALQHRVPKSRPVTFRGDTHWGKTGGLGQEFSSGWGATVAGSLKPSHLFPRSPDRTLGIITGHKAVLCHGGIIQRGHVLVHQIVDGIVPRCARRVSLDFARSASPFLKPRIV